MSSADQQLNDRTEATPATAKSLRLSPVPVERFDEYAVVARLGSGGMAEVFLGLAQGPQGFRKLVAIKRLHASCAAAPELVRMFLHEASLAALLQHPNVVQTHKVGSVDGHHFIAMEYLEGQPLHRALPRLRGGAGLDPMLAVRVVSDLLAGLAYAHDAVSYDGTPLELVHRDVSPQNLFITYDGQVKLLDFGVAKVSAAALDLHTPAGMMKGKLGYIAPEQARGQADRRADVWSAGVMLWEALSGRRLFRGDDPASKLRAVLYDDIPDLGMLRPDLPEQITRVVARALRRDRDQRYASAVEMKRELDAWQAADEADRATKLAPEALPRAALAAAMQTRFANEIRERRAAVLDCFAAVEQEQRWLAIAQTGAQAPRISAPPDEPRASSRIKRIGLSALAASLLLSLWFVASASQPSATRQKQSERAGGAQAHASAQLAGAGALPLSPAQAVAPQVQAEPASNLAAVLARSVPPVKAASGATRLALAPLPVLPHARPLSTVARTRQAASPSTGDGEVALQPALAPSASDTSGAQPAANARGRLRLEATPYAVVSLDGKRLGITPIDVELPAAPHTLTLRNPERGIETTYRVQVVAGESLLRRVELE